MTLPATVNDLVGALQNVQKVMAVKSTDTAFLKLDKGGYWCYGADATEVEPGSRWAINPQSFATGYVCWGDGEVLGEEMALCTEPPIDKAGLPHFEGRKWDEQISINLACISGEDEGLQVRYTATSLGAKKAFEEIVNAVVERATEGHASVVPIVELKVDSYRHKKYGKINTPVLDVVDWAEIGATAQAEPEVEEVEAEEVQPRRRRRARA